MFYELRSLFFDLANMGTLVEMFRGNRRAFSPSGTNDQREIFHDNNLRDISLEFKWLQTPVSLMGHSVISEIRFITSREDLHSRAEIHCEPMFTHAYHNVTANADGLIYDPSGQTKVDCNPVINLFRQLGSGIYIGPFRNAITQGQASYFDISIGTQFIDTWNQWKTGASKAQNLTIEQITEDIRRIFGFKKLEITSSPATGTLQVNLNQRPYKLGEL